MRREEKSVAGTWVVHRQDDNGNRFIVRAGLNRDEALILASEMEARGHKQTYWVEQEGGPEIERISKKCDAESPTGPG